MSEYTSEDALKVRWYNTGYQDGESGVAFDWHNALDDLDIPHEGEWVSPQDVAAEIERQQRSTDLLWHIIRVANQVVIDTRTERDRYKAVVDFAVCPTCHMRSKSGYWRDECNLGHVCEHPYHELFANAERVTRDE